VRAHPAVLSRSTICKLQTLPAYIAARMADIHKEAIAEAYEDVRNDSTDTTWFVYCEARM